MAILTPAQVFRKYVTDGVPDSGVHDPVKAEIVQLLNMLFGVANGAWVVAQTRAALDGVTPDAETWGGAVLNDPDPANNGYYYRSAGAWVRGRGFPDTFAKVALGGSANAQTGIAEPGVNPADIEVFFAVVTTPNTGPMTLSISGETPREVVNLAGNPLAAGEWTGVVMYFLNDDGDYQLLIDAGAAASAAQSASEAQAALDEFNEKYLGAFADDAAATAAAGGSPVTGALYWSTSENRLKTWDGSSWAATDVALADGSVTDTKLATSLKGKLVAFAANRTALAQFDGSTFQSVDLMEAGRKGMFQWDGSDLSAEVTSDPRQGIYVAPVGDTTGASGAWVRRVDGAYDPKWWGAAADAVINDLKKGAGANGANIVASADQDLTLWTASGMTPTLSGSNYYGLPSYLLTEAATSAGHFIRKTLTGIAANQLMTISVLAKAGTRDELRLTPRDPANTTNNLVVYFDLSTGTVTLAAVGSGGDGSIVSTDCIDLGDGWFECRIVGRATTSGASDLELLVYSAEAGSSTTPGSGTINVSGIRVAAGDVDAETYGNDDTRAIQAAIDVSPAGATVDGKGRTYRVLQTLTLRADVTLKGFGIDFSQADNSDTLFEATGTSGTVRSATEAASAGEAEIGFTGAGADADWATDAYVWVENPTEWWDQNDDATYMGEMHRILSKSGSAAVTFRDPMLYAVGQSGMTGRVVKPLDGIHLKDVLAVGNYQGATGNQTGARFVMCQNTVVEDCEFFGFDLRCFSVYRCINPQFRGCDIGHSNKTGFSYGIQFAGGTYFSKVIGCHFVDCRHGTDYGDNDGVNRYGQIIGNTFVQMREPGISTHTAADHIIIADNIIECDPNEPLCGGILIRSLNTSIKDNRILNPGGNGIWCLMTPAFGGTLEVCGNVIVNQAAGDGILVRKAINGGTIRSIKIDGNVIDGNDVASTVGIRVRIQTANVDYLSVCGNTSDRMSGGVHVTTEAVGIIIGMCMICNNMLDGSPTAAEAILISSNDDGLINDVVVNGNNLAGSFTYGVREVNGENVVVTGNNLRAATTKTSVSATNNVVANNLI